MASDPSFLSAKNPTAVFPKIKKVRIRTLEVFQAINIKELSWGFCLLLNIAQQKKKQKSPNLTG